MFAWYLCILTGLVVIYFKQVMEIIWSQHDDCMHDYQFFSVLISVSLSDHAMHNNHVSTLHSSCTLLSSYTLVLSPDTKFFMCALRPYRKMGLDTFTGKTGA